MAHFKLSYSRAFMLRAYPMQTHEMLFDAHYHCLSALGGIPERRIYDNMKTAVDKVKRGKERVVNKRFQAMVSHYLVDAEFCNPAAGWENGQIEKGVQDGRHRLFVGAPVFKSLEDLNVWLEHRCKALWQELPHPKRVSSTCLILFERNRYSVPSASANKVISLRVYAHRLVLIAETTVITEHVRVFSRGHDSPGKTIYDWRHYLVVLQSEPGALRNGAPSVEMPEDFGQLQARLLKSVFTRHLDRYHQKNLKTTTFGKWPKNADLQNYVFVRNTAALSGWHSCPLCSR